MIGLTGIYFYFLLIPTLLILYPFTIIILMVVIHSSIYIRQDNLYKIRQEQMLKQQTQQYSRNQFHADVQKLTVVAITWNLFGSLPPTNSLVKLKQSATLVPPPDVIYFGTQECQRSLSMAFCCEGKDLWQDMLKECFSQYFLGASHLMTGLHAAVLIHQKFRNNYEVQHKQKLRAGTCNLMGNKGAISIQVVVFGQKFQFINCHLAAHQGQSLKRNLTIERILSTMVRKDLSSEVIFLGDMNYRIDMTKQQYEQMISNRVNTEEEMKFSKFLPKDQLNNQTILQQQFLSLFEEGTITFPPTYKIGVFNKQYNKQRIPGWTDRIFHRKGKKINRVKYHCEYDIQGSDHRPVIARYERTVDDKTYTYNTDHFVPVTSSKCQLI